MPVTAANGSNIYYEWHGNGPPLIMIRGLGSNSDHWYSQLPALKSKFRVLIFDNRGIARSSDSSDKFTASDMAKDTIALMDALKIQKAHILGFSLGGMVAQEISINYPEKVRGLVLVATHAGGKKQIKASAKTTKLFEDMVYTGSSESKIQAAPTLFDPLTIEKKPEVLKEYAKVSLRHPAGPEILIKQWDAINTHNTYERLSKIQAATLVLSGDADLLIPLENSEILSSNIPNAKLVIVPGGGHQILVEQPDTCNKVIMEFLLELAS